MVTGRLGGLHIVSLLDAHVAIVSVPMVCVLELIAVAYTYGPKNMAADVKFMTGRPLNKIWMFLWRYVLPALLLIMITYSLREASGVAGWCVALVSVVFIPLHAVQLLLKTKGSFKQRLHICSQPNSLWGPVEPDIRCCWEASKRHTSFSLDSTVLHTDNISRRN